MQVRFNLLSTLLVILVFANHALLAQMCNTLHDSLHFINTFLVEWSCVVPGWVRRPPSSGRQSAGVLYRACEGAPLCVTVFFFYIFLSGWRGTVWCPSGCAALPVA